MLITSVTHSCNFINLRTFISYALELSVCYEAAYNDIIMQKTRFACLFLVCGIVAGTNAQAPVVGARYPEKLFRSGDKNLNRNKQVVLHIIRDLLEAGHWRDAPKYLTERYIQHNPNVPNGRKAVMQFFGAFPVKPIPNGDQWSTKVVSVLAEGDLVMVATVRKLPHPTEKGKTYTTTWFDMWRIKDGKADEHWDGATMMAAPKPGK